MKSRVTEIFIESMLISFLITGTVISASILGIETVVMISKFFQ